MIRKIARFIILFGGYMLHRNCKSKVLFYHDIGKLYTDMGTSKNVIRKHLNVIKKQGFQIVRNISQSKQQIMICFDDGWKGIYDEREFFVKENVFPTVFLAVDLIGSEGHLTINQIEELLNMGFLFETHSWSHKDLTLFDTKGLEHELIDSKKSLEEMLSMQFEALCFPEGKFSNEVLTEAKRAGYKKIYSSISGSYYDKIEDGIICRNLVQDFSAIEVKFIIEGQSDILKNRNIRQHFKN